MKIKAPRGTKDILPEEARRWQYAEARFRDVCHRYGYGEIRVPTFESTDLFERGVGDSTDIVRKEMYTFEDKGGRSMTLRPEGTAGVVRAYVEQGMNSLPSPVRLFYDLNMFRYEKMQKGRYREFAQFGCEIFGSDSALADAEILSLLDTFFTSVGLRERRLELGSIGCPACRPRFLEALRAYYEPKLDRVCEDCRDRFEKNPLRMLDCKQPQCQEDAERAPSQIDFLCDECEAHFALVRQALDTLGIDYHINPRMVRGLDYYTRTVFEFVSTHVGSQGALCGGGRYDGLVEELGGGQVPAIGFAMGVERLLLEMEAQHVQPDLTFDPDLFIVSFPDTTVAALHLRQNLIRDGFIVETDVMDRSFRAQMKAADRANARYLLVLGADELKKSKATLRRMDTGEETELQLSDLSQTLRSE